jgi:hypothetical protein
MRSRRTVRSSCTGSESGTSKKSPRLTKTGAKIQTKTLTATKTANTTWTTPEASLQAPRRSSRVRKPVKVGINAEPSAPPAIKLNSSSVTRLAALNESSSALVPKAWVMTIPRTTPTRLLMMYASITRLAARAITLPAEGDPP